MACAALSADDLRMRRSHRWFAREHARESALERKLDFQRAFRAIRARFP
jgi:hypothetical protein